MKVNRAAAPFGIILMPARTCLSPCRYFVACHLQMRKNIEGNMKNITWNEITVEKFIYDWGEQTEVVSENRLLGATF